MIGFPFMVEFPSDEAAWILSIIGCSLIGACVGLLTSYNTGIAAILGPKFIGALFQGQGLA